MKSQFGGGFTPPVSDRELDDLVASGSFDEHWYLNEYPDVEASGIAPARHYPWIGRRLGRRPSATALPGAGPASGPANAASQTQSASEISVASSKKSGLLSAATRWAEKSSRKFRQRSDGLDPHVVATVEQGFDVEYYLTNNPDVAEAGVDPIEHYLFNGWREGRDPSLQFSTRYYLDNNPDVAEAGVNPFFHWLAAGRAEGREGRHQLGFRWDMLSRLKPVMEQIADFKSSRTPYPLASKAVLQASLRSALERYPEVMISFSHDDFTRHVGGVQLLLRRELAELRKRQLLQIHIYPMHALPFVETTPDPVQLGVLIDGQDVGVYTASDIAACLRETITKQSVLFVVHSLLGQNIDECLKILGASGAKRGFVWIHDYSPLYNNYKLLRNDVEYRGIPKRGTIAWDLCEYARAPFSQAEEFAKLFSAFEIELLSPSELAMDIWNESGLLVPARKRVVPHVELRTIASRPALKRPAAGPLRVGFLGYPVHHKGWGAFEELVSRFGDDSRYRFYHIGNGQRGGLPVEYREVIATEREPDLMRKAVAAVELDVAFTWSIWPETFCLAAYEAVGAGAALLTNRASGNVAVLAKRQVDGMVLDDEDELNDVFAKGDVLSLARSYRAVHLYELDYSSVTLAALD